MTVWKAVCLQIRGIAWLADMMVDDSNLLLAKTSIGNEILLASPQITEKFEGVIFWYLADCQGFELPDEHRSYIDSCPGEGLCKNCLAGDAICIDMRYNGHRLVGKDL